MTRREVRLSGFGGQGIILSGNILGKAAAIFFLAINVTQDNI